MASMCNEDYGHSVNKSSSRVVNMVLMGPKCSLCVSMTDPNIGEGRILISGAQSCFPISRFRRIIKSLQVSIMSRLHSFMCAHSEYSICDGPAGKSWVLFVEYRQFLAFQYRPRHLASRIIRTTRSSRCSLPVLKACESGREFDGFRNDYVVLRQCGMNQPSA